MIIFLNFFCKHGSFYFFSKLFLTFYLPFDTIFTPHNLKIVAGTPYPDKDKLNFLHSKAMQNTQGERGYVYFFTTLNSFVMGSPNF